MAGDYTTQATNAKWTERQRAMEEAAQICERQIRVFLSSQFAVGQPASSFRERFAAAACARAIRCAAGLPDPHAENEA